MLKLKIFEFNSFAENCYVVWNENHKHCIIIDPGCQSENEKNSLFNYLEGNKLTPIAVLLTHAHADHCYGVASVCSRYNINVFLHKNEEVFPPVFVEDFSPYKKEYSKGMFYTANSDIKYVENEVDNIQETLIQIPGMDIKVIETPGHSKGSVSLLINESGHPESAILFSGDTLFAGCIGRTDLPGGDYDEIMNSIRNKLMSLEGNTDVLPGHGPSSTIADERTKNPFITETLD